MIWWSLGLMVTVVVLRLVLAKNLRQSLPLSSDLKEICATDWPTACAWMAGGATRMHEYGFAVLSSSGAVKNRNGVCVKLPTPARVRHAWPKWIEEAYDHLPNAVPMSELPKHWRSFADRWELMLLERGYLVKPCSSLVRLYRLLMLSVMLLSAVVLYLWGAPWLVFVGLMGFWSLLGAWLFFCHLPILLAPRAFLELQAHRQLMFHEMMENTPKHLLSMVALEGSGVLRGTPFASHAWFDE